MLQLLTFEISWENVSENDRKRGNMEEIDFYRVCLSRTVRLPVAVVWCFCREWIRNAAEGRVKERHRSFCKNNTKTNAQTQRPIMIICKPKIKRNIKRAELISTVWRKHWNINLKEIKNLKNEKLLFKTYIVTKLKSCHICCWQKCLNNMFISWKFWTIKTGYVLIHGVQI